MLIILLCVEVNEALSGEHREDIEKRDLMPGIFGAAN